jgi:hypothetical protein
MKQVLVLVAIVLAGSLQAQEKQNNWYQKEKAFHPFLSFSAAVPNPQMFKDISTFKGSDIWTTVSAGIMNKNTGVDVYLSSYEWNNWDDINVGLTFQRRLFYINKFETWAGVASGIPIGKRADQFRIQPSIRFRYHADKAVAFGLEYGQVLHEKGHYSLNEHRAISATVQVSLHGNPHSAGK